MRVDAPRTFARVDKGEALGEGLRHVAGQRRQGGLEIHPPGVVVSAHRKREAGPGDAHAPRLGPVLAQVHRVRDLPQLLVEHRADLVARQRIRRAQHHDRADSERADDP